MPIAPRKLNRPVIDNASGFRTSALSVGLILLIGAVLTILNSTPVSAIPIIHQTYPIDNVTVLEGETVVFVVELETGIDPSKTIIQWYKEGSPVIGSGLSYTYIPDFNSSGIYKITVIVVYNASTASHDWNLTVKNVKQKFSVETWTPSGDVTITNLEPKQFSCTVKNPANDTLTYLWFIDNELQMGFNQSTFTYSPGMSSSGERLLRLAVRSSDHSEEGIWKVIVVAPLEVRPEGHQTVREGENLTFTVLTPGLLETDIKWTMDQGAQPSATGRAFTYLPDFSSAGTHTIKMETGQGRSYEWSVKVTDVDRPPVIDQGRLIKAQVGQSAKLRAMVSDPDNDLVKFEWDFEGDGTFEYFSDRDDPASHTYKKSGTYLAVFKVTDAHGEAAVMTYVVEVTEPTMMSPWAIGAVILGVLVILVIVWTVMDITKTRKKARLEAEARAREQAEIREKARARAEAERAARMAQPRRQRAQPLPIFEDIPEPTDGRATEHGMVPYASKMADRGQESEGAAAEGDAIEGVGAETASEGSTAMAGEGTRTAEKEELDDLLKSLATRTATKSDLKAKKASAEAGAEDIDRDAIGPSSPGSRGKGRRPKAASGQTQKKGTKKDTERTKGKEDLKGGSGKGADADIEPQASDEVDEVMQRLVDMGLAERKKK